MTSPLGPPTSRRFRSSQLEGERETAGWRRASAALENRGQTGSCQFFLTWVVNGQTVGLCPQFTFSSSTNRITTSGYTYDAAGNMTNDGGHAYTWDAEGRMATVDAGSTATYTYDALGQRVEGDVAGNPENFYLYDPAGNLLNAPFTDGWGGDELTEPVAGRVLASYVNGRSDTYFKHPNALGSWGLMTAHDGSVPQDQLYYPWGQTWTSGHYLFEPNYAAMTWYNAESDLFLTPARSYGSRLGRWMSPDLLGGDVTNPQSLNRYAYALNNPTSLTDPTGLDSAFTIDGGCNDTISQLTNAVCRAGGGGGGGNGSGYLGEYLNGFGYPPDMPPGALGSYNQYLQDNCIGCWSFSGTLYGQTYTNQSFSSIDAYLDWRTSLAAQPQSQAYQVYMLACQYATNPCSGTNDSVSVWLKGITYNGQINSPLDVAAAAQDGFQDPTGMMHNGDDSWYIGSFAGLFGFEVGHVVNNPYDEEVHYDDFGPLNPLHYVTQVPLGAIMGTTPTTYTCSVIGGCH